jgi:hypothetical protein
MVQRIRIKGRAYTIAERDVKGGMASERAIFTESEWQVAMSRYLRHRRLGGK